MGYGAACRLFALMVRDAAVHRREQSRPAGEDSRSTPCCVGRSEKDAPRHLALDFTGWDQGYFGTAKRITSSQEGAPHHSTRVSVREGARSCFSKRAILTGSAFDSVSRHLRRVSLTHLATTSLRHVRIRNSATRTPNPLAFSSDNAPKKRRQEKMISLCGAANKIGNDGALNFRLSAVVPSCHSACSHKRDAAN